MSFQRFKKVLAGIFVGADVQDIEGAALGGGLIRRPPHVAAALNSTRVNCRGPHQLRDAQCDVFEDVHFGYIYDWPERANAYVGFQYVEQDAYKGVVPWEIMPQVPESEPWE